jgi:uncharacterized delta-60 repeat protein
VRGILFCIILVATLPGCKSWGKFWSWKLSGTVVNLKGSGLALGSPGLENTSIGAGATSFAFTLGVLSGSEYRVTVASPAAGQQCIVTNGNGIATADVTNIIVTCYASGSFDTSFGAGLGYKQISAIANYATSFDLIQALEIDAQNRILITGQTENTSPNAMMFLCRLFESGNLDTMFASAASTPGCATLLVATDARAYNLSLNRPDGKIYITGDSINAGSGSMITARYLDNGSIDTSFNGTGYVTRQQGPGTVTGEGRIAIADADGKVLIGGRTNCSGTCDWTLWRYTSAGALDTTFVSPTGYSQIAGGYGTVMDAYEDTARRILAVGFANSQLTIRRYSSNGVQDSAFAAGGTYTYPNGSFISSAGHTLTVTDSGFFVTGLVEITGTNTNMALWKFKTDGSSDTSFNGGLVTHDNPGGSVGNSFDWGHSVAVDAFGRVLVSGVSCNNTGYDTCGGGNQKGNSIVVWRYMADGTADATFNNGLHYKLVTDRYFHQNAYTSMARMKLDSSGRIVLVGCYDPDAAASGDGCEARIYRLYN